MKIPFDNAYASLPAVFHAASNPVPVKEPTMIRFNVALAQSLGLDANGLAASADIWGGNGVPAGAQPVAMAYAGHQFGGFSPRLGDGRAVLLGQIGDPSGRGWDIHLKGSGPTPYSRGGDGRAWIGPVLREYVVSEAMHALGIPTTRALAAVRTGQPVFRETALPGAVLTRVARSHIRVGTFEYFGARRDAASLRTLLDHVIQRYFPEHLDAPSPELALLEEVGKGQASLVANWMSVGFIHGVMNTDNCAVLGDTIDYGPCAFMDAYRSDKVFSSIDHRGRYAYNNQASIAQWNLAAFARSLMPLIADDPETVERAQGIIDAFPGWFDVAHAARMTAKLGLTEVQDGDMSLVDGLLQTMEAQQADFTITFRALCDPDVNARSLFADPAAFDRWAVAWRLRLAKQAANDAERQESMRAVNPAYIPRNHRVEEIIQAAVNGDDEPFERLLEVVRSPFIERPEWERFALAPAPHEVVCQTFCGT